MMFFMTVFYLFCHAQMDSLIKNDSSKIILKSLKNYSIKGSNINHINLQNYSSETRSPSSRFALYYDTLYQKSMLYDNYKHEYFLNDPIRPYSTFQNALLGGSLNYLFLLFERRK